MTCKVRKTKTRLEIENAGTSNSPCLVAVRREERGFHVHGIARTPSVSDKFSCNVACMVPIRITRVSGLVHGLQQLVVVLLGLGDEVAAQLGHARRVREIKRAPAKINCSLTLMFKWCRVLAGNDVSCSFGLTTNAQ